MKAEPLKTKVFTPIVLTLETPQEVIAVFALLNYSTLARTVGVGDAGLPLQIRDANTAAGNPPIDYGPAHDALREVVKSRN